MLLHCVLVLGRAVGRGYVRKKSWHRDGSWRCCCECGAWTVRRWSTSRSAARSHDGNSPRGGLTGASAPGTWPAPRTQPPEPTSTRTRSNLIQIGLYRRDGGGGGSGCGRVRRCPSARRTHDGRQRRRRLSTTPRKIAATHERRGLAQRRHSPQIHRRLTTRICNGLPVRTGQTTSRRTRTRRVTRRLSLKRFALPELEPAVPCAVARDRRWQLKFLTACRTRRLDNSACAMDCVAVD